MLGLEDVLRGVAAWKLPAAPKAVLDDIPLIGAPSATKRLPLGDLAAHRGKSIDSLIEASVESYLQRSNYNNTGEIAKLMDGVGIDISKVNGRFADLEDMMQRRHQIVHRADRKSQVSGSGDHTVRAINKHTVRTWAAAVQQFGNDLLAEV